MYDFQLLIIFFCFRLNFHLLEEFKREANVVKFTSGEILKIGMSMCFYYYGFFTRGDFLYKSTCICRCAMGG